MNPTLWQGGGRDERAYGIGNDFDADGELAEDFSVGFGGDAMAEAVGGEAIDRIGADEMDLAEEGMVAEEDGHEKAEIIEAAAGVEGDKMKAVAVEGGSGAKSRSTPPKLRTRMARSWEICSMWGRSEPLVNDASKSGTEWVAQTRRASTR
jgi:hypothetical protein